MKFKNNMIRYLYIFLTGIMFTCCFQNTNVKENRNEMEKNIFDFEDIYSNQQKNGDELGPWWIFYKVNIHNITDSILSIYPKKDSISFEGFEHLRTLRKIEIDTILNYIFPTSGIGDVFLIFKKDTIPLYCRHRPIVLSKDSCYEYRFYTNPQEINKLFYNSYVNEYQQFQCFMSDIVNTSTFVVILNKKDTCYLYPQIELNFYGDSLESGEWSF